eukprot:TRINITY_DN1895_c0_g1_i1.p1 TRINITY_DN1895_c0_g1~~TRINITY_DN1895_c0_g1_i1.p1  ORF type:complete len:542 (-),score=168.93 TRINITY_DN1895_c0_g1_i1:184-1809(-)
MTSIEDKYKLGEVLGEGAYSVVQRVTRLSDGKELAVKVMSKWTHDPMVINAEIEVLQSIDHENLITLHEVIETANSYYLVMDLVAGGELFDDLLENEYYGEADAGDIIRQVLEGLNYLHENNIVHRDMKPDNVLTTASPDRHVRIADFGLAASFPQGETPQMMQECGTPGYQAPEKIRAAATGMPYGREVDVWGVGVIAYVALCGYAPFTGDSDYEIECKVLEGDLHFPAAEWDGVSDAAKDFVRRLLDPNENERMTCAEALKHAWMFECPSLPVLEADSLCSTPCPTSCPTLAAAVDPSCAVVDVVDVVAADSHDNDEASCSFSSPADVDARVDSDVCVDLDDAYDDACDQYDDDDEDVDEDDDDDDDDDGDDDMGVAYLVGLTMAALDGKPTMDVTSMDDYDLDSLRTLAIQNLHVRSTPRSAVVDGGRCTSSRSRRAVSRIRRLLTRTQSPSDLAPHMAIGGRDGDEPHDPGGGQAVHDPGGPGSINLSLSQRNKRRAKNTGGGAGRTGRVGACGSVPPTAAAAARFRLMGSFSPRTA